MFGRATIRLGIGPHSSSSFFLSSPNLSRRRLDVYHTSTHAGLKRAERGSLQMQDAKNRQSRHLRTIVQLCRAISSQLRHASTIGKKLVNQQYLLQMSAQYGEHRPLAAEMCWRVWGTPANFNGLRVLAALLHDSRVAEVSQTLRR